MSRFVGLTLISILVAFALLFALAHDESGSTGLETTPAAGGEKPDAPKRTHRSPSKPRKQDGEETPILPGPEPPPLAEDDDKSDEQNEPHRTTARVVGRVVGRDGIPVPEARIVLRQIKKERGGGVASMIRGRASSDDEGRFEFDHLSLGQVEIMFDRSDPSHVEGAERSVLLDEPTTYDLGDVVLGEPGCMELNLRVLLPDGSPAKGLLLCVSAYDVNKAGARSAYSDDKGEATFRSWRPESGLSLSILPPEGMEPFSARILPDSMRSYFEGMLREDGYLARSREYVWFYVGNHFERTITLEKKKEKPPVPQGTLVLHLPPKESSEIIRRYLALGIGDVVRSESGRIEGDGGTVEIQVPKDRYRVFVYDMRITRGEDGHSSWTTFRFARRDMVVEDRAEWDVEFEDALWARGRLLVDGKPAAGVRYRMHFEGLPYYNDTGRTHQDGRFLFALDPHAARWAYEFDRKGADPWVLAIAKRPTIVDEKGRRVIDLGDVSLQPAQDR